MPKPLSLKKVAPLKSQKSIAVYFKDPKGVSSKAGQKPSHVNSVEQVQISPQKSTKRKASSPLLETINKGDKLPVEITEHLVSITSTTQHKTKKLKENGANYQSPVKDVEQSMLNKSPEKMSRSPLCSVDNLYAEVTENHVKINASSKKILCSPTKVLPLKTENGMCSPRKCNITPKKNEKVNGELRRSPRIAKLKTPEKSTISPVKNGSAKLALDFGDQIEDDMFGDDWDAGDIEENLVEDLDLSCFQRCEVLSITHSGSAMELQLKNDNGQQGTCLVEGVWRDTPVSAGDILSVVAERGGDGRYHVGNAAGLLVLRPDHLMSTTSVVAGVFCRRKAVLQERFKGIDSSNTAMTVGILIHELVQKALLNKISDTQKLRKETQQIIKQSTGMLYDAGISEEEAASNMEAYIQPLADFMKTYVIGKTPPSGKDQWPGHIDEVLDIEENVCCPSLGLKGKIDATLAVTIHDRKGKRKSEVPLELKSGRASGSAEHRGQLLLYCMMLAARDDAKPNHSATTDTSAALLLYLRDRVDLREVSGGHPERRDLIMLRNQLVQYLTASPEDIDPESLNDIEEAANVLSQKLPDPISFENACSKCAYLTVCSLHLWHTSGPAVSDTHPLSKLRSAALGHLSAAHVRYFLQWAALLRMEERSTTSFLRALWTEDAAVRKKRGVCAANLKLKSVEPSGDRFLHVFIKPVEDQGVDGKHCGPAEGEFSIVSVSQRPWLAAGAVQAVKGPEIHVLLERNLSRRLAKDTLYHLDSYSSNSAAVQNLTNLAALMEDSPRAQRLREIIIDKSGAEFEEKLSRETGRLGAKLMRSLNIEQQRAVLKALAAKNYALLQGLPGTGKTQTISVLIQMLVALKQRVLVTAHTHSAVDTVLTRLPSTVRVLRLGAPPRVSAALQPRTERSLAACCGTPEDLAQLYDSMEVVGVTCLGAAHAMLARTTFDVCIVDEVTQVLQSTALRPLLSARRLVLVGDPDQLPPLVRSRAARRLGMEESLFHRLADEASTSTLRLQYRMNAPLAALANSVAYAGRLKCATDQVRDATIATNVSRIESLYGTRAPWLVKVCSQKPEEAALFIDMDSKTDKTTKTKSLSNANEACVVLAIVDALIEAGVSNKDIGIIAPYREQVSLLCRSTARARAAAPDVSTVDQFQGRDKSVIIYSCTRSDGGDETTVKEGEVLNDQRRLAVSVTRAKHKFIVVGHSTALKRYTSLQLMINACMRVSLKDSEETIFTKFSSYVS